MTPDRSSRLARNVVHFARLLRSAGLPIGPHKVLNAVEAASWVGVGCAEDFRAALQAALIDRADQREIFDQAFRLFWRDPKLMERMMHAMLPKAPARLSAKNERLPERLASALSPASRGAESTEHEKPLEFDAAYSFSQREVLRQKDFETMTLEELAEARRMLRSLRLALPYVRTRRYAANAAGRRLDLRATLRQSLRAGGEWIVQRKRERRVRPSGLVALCDVSGSMSRYSRMLLHFLHAVSSEHRRVHAFTFATRLTNITRALRHRDVDQALDQVGRSVPDWSGGTRIGACLHEFNWTWARRLLGQGTVVLLVTDGLDCGDAVADLAGEMSRLRKSCIELVWLNPLLRFEGFEPRAAGIRSMLPHVDRFLPAHNVASLTDLGRVLATRSNRSLH